VFGIPIRSVLLLLHAAIRAERKRLSEGRAHRPAHRWQRIGLWVLAVLLMLAAAVYQRLTGPTHPLRGSFEVQGRAHRYRLVRSGTTTGPAEVQLPDPGAGFAATLRWRRFPTDEAYTEVAMQRGHGLLRAPLPVQPAAGKVEYFVELRSAGTTLRVPESDTVILRHKDPVPLGALLPHVLLMFFAVLFGIRAGLAALFAPEGMRGLAWIALAGITIGGMILGPIVQKYAFGAYWTGWPFGTDLTDNKSLVMWVVWLLACLVIGRRPLRRESLARALVLAAALVMSLVYLIPHSLRGSELDYTARGQVLPFAD
jgi:hypothetical protein